MWENEPIVFIFQRLVSIINWLFESLFSKETIKLIWDLFFNKAFLKLLIYCLIFWLIIRVLRELKYRAIYWHSSWFFERLISFRKPVFKVRDNFFTQSEENFYKNLKEVLYKLFQYRYEVYPKTRLNDVFETKYSKDRFMQSHCDFLIVDRHQNFKPVLAIEVDWDSHKNRWQKKSDKFKDKVFEETWLPLVRVKNEQSKEIQVAYAIIYKYLKKLEN